MVRDAGWTDPAQGSHRERAVSGLRDLFALNAYLVFYDLASTYFEGGGPATLVQHGHRWVGKPWNRQVLLGLLMVDGWPIVHRESGATKNGEAPVFPFTHGLRGILEAQREKADKLEKKGIICP